MRNPSRNPRLPSAPAVLPGAVLARSMLALAVLVAGCSSPLPMADPVPEGPGTAGLRFSTSRRDSVLVAVNTASCPDSTTGAVLAAPDATFWKPKAKTIQYINADTRIAAGKPVVFEVQRAGDCLAAGVFTPRDQVNYEIRLTYDSGEDRPTTINVAVFERKPLGPNQIEMTAEPSARIRQTCDIKSVCTLAR